MEETPEHLIIRYLTKEATATETEMLRRWLAQSAANQKIFNEYAESWQHAAALAPTFAVAENLQKLNALIDQEEKQSKRKVTLFWSAAAAVVLLLSVGLLLFRQAQPVNRDYAERITAKGQKLTLRLADGTTVKLNANSSLKFPEQFDSKKREVYLQGEAFFDVAHNPEKPFLIHSKNVTTQVLGTSFNVRSRHATTEIAVRTGKVNVFSNQQSQLLLPQQKIICDGATWRVEQTSLNRELAWTNNEILIEDQPLAQVARVLEEWYGIKIQLGNDAMATCRVTGSFKNEPLENVLKAISLSINIEYAISGKKVVLQGKGCLR